MDVRTFGADIRVMYPVLRSISLILGLALGGLAHGQLLDSIAYFHRMKPRPVARFDARNSFISNGSVGFWGVKLGLEHGKRFQYGAGYAFLRTRNERLTHTVDGMRTVHLRVGYVSPYVDYAFFARGPWEARIPVQFGVGRARTVYRGADQRWVEHERSMVYIYEPTMTVQYRFWKYFGVVGGWGFRLTVQQRGLGERMSAPIYVLGMRVFAEELYRDLRGRGY